jgi:hypothetical protein
MKPKRAAIKFVPPSKKIDNSGGPGRPHSLAATLPAPERRHARAAATLS